MHLDPLLRLLAVASVVGVLAASGLATAVAGGVLLGDDHAGPAGRVVPGAGGSSYRVPEGSGWVTTDEPVSYRDARGTAYATGVSASFHTGRPCSIDGSQTPDAWAVLLAPARVDDPATYAARTVLRWARGYGTGAPVSPPVLRRVSGDRLRADVRIDLSRAEGACLGRHAEVSVVVAQRDGRAAGLVAARQVGVPGGLSDDDFESVVGSFRR